jgi:hypothetical protein
MQYQVEVGIMNADRSDPDSIREEQARRKGHPFLTAALVLLAIGLAGFAWYAYPILGRHDALLSQTQLQIPTIQRYVMSLDDDAKAMDARIRDWSSRQEDLRSQLTKVRGDLMARVESAKKQASDSSIAMIERVRGEFGTQIDGVKTEMAREEASSAGDREQISRLQQELAQVRGQVNQQGQELASVQGRVEQNAASSQQEFAAVKNTQQQDRHDFDTYSDKFAVKRVDFEVTKNHGSEVAPGIVLEVNSTDISYQRVSGSVLVNPDGRTIWLRQLKVQEPVFLSSFADGRTRELVITRVSKNGAVGYALVPAKDATTSQAPSE